MNSSFILSQLSVMVNLNGCCDCGGPGWRAATAAALIPALGYILVVLLEGLFPLGKFSRCLCLHGRLALVFVPLRAQTSNTIVNCNTGNPLLRTAMAAAANADSGGYRRTARRQTEFDGLTSGRQLPAPRTAYLIELQNSIRAAVLHTLLLFLRRNRRRRRQRDGNFTREDLNVFNYPPHLTFFHTLSFRANFGRR